jgi:hypothetical protein
MDVDAMQKVLEVLNKIPSDLEPGGGASVSDLKDCVHISEYLSGFGNGGNADSWIADHVGDLYQEINLHVQDLKTQCGVIGSLLDASIKSYKTADSGSSNAVKKSAQSDGPTTLGAH